MRKKGRTGTLDDAEKERIIREGTDALEQGRVLEADFAESRIKIEELGQASFF